MRMFGLFRQGPAVDVASVAARVRQGEVLLVDVREPGEFRTGHASGAVNVPMAQLTHRLRPGGTDCLASGTGQPIVLYCATGSRSWMAARMLRKMGYGDVINLGGLQVWQRGGGAVSTG